MTIFGYARVSTDGQTLDAQIAALKAAGAEKVHTEKQSQGRRQTERRWDASLAALERGDVLMVHKLDRLARSTRDLLNVLATVSERGAGFRSISDQWADTTTPHGRLMLTVLGGMAEFERSFILSRTSDGRTRAMARGVRLLGSGASKPHRTRLQRREPVGRWRGSSHWEIGRSYNVSSFHDIETINVLIARRLR